MPGPNVAYPSVVMCQSFGSHADDEASNLKWLNSACGHESVDGQDRLSLLSDPELTMDGWPAPAFYRRGLRREEVGRRRVSVNAGPGDATRRLNDGAGEAAYAVAEVVRQARHQQAKDVVVIVVGCVKSSRVLATQISWSGADINQK